MPPVFSRSVLGVSLVFVFCLGNVGCARFGEFAKKRADKAAYGVIEEKQREALGETRPLSIDRVEEEAAERLLASARRLDNSTAAYTTPTYTLSLADALAIAVANNRAYLTEKEQVFTQALDLTNTRRDYSVIFTGSADASVTRTDSGHDAPGGGVVERFGSRGFALGAAKALATGADVSLSFTHDFVRYFTHESRPSASNELALSVVQPLLKGAGPLVAREGLRQAERDMIYRTRNFQRFQQEFVIGAAERFYGLLSSRDQLRNTYNNLDSVRANWNRMGVLFETGRRSQLEVDQARQEVLKAEERWSNVQASYAGQLESFRDFLGLSVDLDIGPDPGELDAIAQRELIRPDMELAEAVGIALEDRLDLKTAEEQAEDAERGVKIAMRGFLPNLDATYEYNTSQDDDKDRVKLNFRDNRQFWGLSLGLPFDWTPRRNAYRKALIAHEQARRTFDQKVNDVIRNVRDAWRELERLRTSYMLQQESVKLAERRVDAAAMYLEKGEITTRDWLEAQQDLLEAQNAQSRALVDHTIQRLRLWDAIERFKIDPKGMWYE
jgi:outer membrane protein TolC